MNTIIYNETELPMQDLETIGLAAGGQVLLNEDDLKALLSGRRTGMQQLQNLEAENIKIRSMDAKVSVRRAPSGKTELVIHPVYRKPATPDMLEDFEAAQLEKGEIASLLKVTRDPKGNAKEVLIEYDPDTREFIVSDTEKIMAPDMVNGEFLTAAQKENYRKGKEVKIPDGTRFNYSAADPKGMRSNKIALIASILIDGGLTYFAYRALNAIFGQKRDEKEVEKLSAGYYNALRDMQEYKSQPSPEQREINIRAVKR
jgi:hypothetical protein